VVLWVVGCASRTQSSSPSESVLLPGSRALASAFVGNTSWRYHTVQMAPGSDSVVRDLGEGREAVSVTTYQGAPALLIVDASTPRGTPYVDSALVWRRGLAPIWEVYHLGTRATRIDYDGPRVRRTDAWPDSTRRADHTYDVRVFHFTELDAIIQSVPFRVGYRAIVPLYSEGDDALEMDTVQVQGRDATGVWDVRFADNVIIGHYGIDGTTRAIARYAIERHAGGPHFRLVIEP
jgi:hypothetical protein